MRTAIIIIIGFLIWGACIGVSKILGNHSAFSMEVATYAFIGIWFGISATNMWIGISKAGYSFFEELPIFLVIFLIPSIVAFFVKIKFL